MRKSTIFISAALTTFALVMLYGVASAYRGIVNLTEAPTQSAVVTPAPAGVTPEQAAQLASLVLGRTDLLSAESSSINGVNAYKISFLSGDVVYVGMDGQILSVQAVPQVITVQAQPSSNNNRTTTKSSNESHEGHDD